VGRREGEAKEFNIVSTWLGRDFRVVHLEVSEETNIARLNKRREIEGRKDDEGDKLKNRFNNYNAETFPALEYFRSLGKVVEINGEPDPETVFKEVLEKLEPYL
jgi:adenylate kinase